MYLPLQLSLPPAYELKEEQGRPPGKYSAKIHAGRLFQSVKCPQLKELVLALDLLTEPMMR
jgi:hypothetical protein